jgi:spore germination protein
MSQIISDNELVDPTRLVTGQTLVILFPNQTHTVQSGETLTGIAEKYGLSTRQMLRNNPALGGEMTIYPGQTLVISYQPEQKSTLSVNAYAYPFITDSLLRRTLPYLTNLTPFTYGMTENGELVDLEDEKLIAMAKEMGVSPLMHLSTLTDEGNFSSDLASLILNDSTIQTKLTNNIIKNMQAKGYSGLDVDFEFIPAKDALPYADFIRSLANKLHPLGYKVYTALAPKTSTTQAGLLYQGHSYPDLGAAADGVLLMTYEWGYTFHPVCYMLCNYKIGCLPFGRHPILYPMLIRWRMPSS